MIGADTEVSNSHEPSYYEIALTNRQVVVAFVILLVCLLSAFFSGVWLGRESTMRAQEQLAQAGVTAQQEPKEGQALEEFEFFGDAQRPAQPEPQPEPEPAQPATPTPAPAPADSTLLEDFGGDAGDLEDEPPSDLQDVRTDERVVMPTEEERRRARRAEMEAVEPAPRQPERRAEREEPARPRSEAATPATPAATSSAPAPARGGAVIQVFSSPEKDQAERIRDRLVRGGHKAFLSPVEVAGRTMYRVRIGPFDSRGKADEVAGQVRKGFKLDTWVTQ